MAIPPIPPIPPIKDHTKLTNIGTNTHAQIDTALGTTIPGTYLPLAGGTMTGNLLFTDNTLDIGASGATRPRTLYLGTGATIPALTISTSTIGSYLTASEMLITDADKKIVSAPVATYPSLTELTYVKGVTSAIQTQLNAKAATLSGTQNEIAYFNTTSTIASLAVATYPSLTELSYVKGVTSAIQTQIGTKAPSTAPTFATSITGSYLTASEILITDADKKIVSAAVATYPSLTELTYVKGVTSAIQTQIGTKANSASPTFTGTVTLPTVQLGETSIKLDATLSGDATWSGITTSGTSGVTTLAIGNLIYLNADDSRWELADANLSDGYDKQLGIALTAAADGEALEILLFGKVRSAAFPAFTVGSPLYMSETAGDVTHTAPVTADACIRLLGFALTAEDMMFNPDNTYTTHT